jgi:hypothetical protein
MGRLKVAGISDIWLRMPQSGKHEARLLWKTFPHAAARHSSSNGPRLECTLSLIWENA